jgi:two-component system, chemotaxis family, response regulator Rcp1
VLVDDSFADVFLIREVIRKRGLPLEMEVVEDGEQAMFHFQALERDASLPRPELVLLDLNLPRRGGHEVLAWLRASRLFRHTPVIVVTSSDAEADRALANRLGATGYFRKSFSYDEFLQLGAVIEDALQREAPTSVEA